MHRGIPCTEPTLGQSFLMNVGALCVNIFRKKSRKKFRKKSCTDTFGLRLFLKNNFQYAFMATEMR
jgi:hypothetical protein